MPRVTTVKSARKAPGRCMKCSTPIRAGDPYRWWKFRFGGKRIVCSKPECAPRPSDLTQSEFYSRLYEIQDSIETAVANRDADSLRSAADELRDLGSECEDKRSNMPDSLQDSETGQLLEERAGECEDKASEIEDAASELEDLPDPDDWKTYAEENGEERKLKKGVDGDDPDLSDDDKYDETEEEFEARVREMIEEANNDEWNNQDFDLSIS